MTNAERLLLHALEYLDRMLDDPRAVDRMRLQAGVRQSLYEARLAITSAERTDGAAARRDTEMVNK